MSLELNVTVANPLLSTLEGLRVHYALHNGSPAPMELPTLENQTDALSLDIYDEAGRLVRRMNGLTSQEMTSVARVDHTPDLARLPAGESWYQEIDYAEHHYGLPAGKFLVEAVYAWPPAGVELRSGRHPIEVRAPPVMAVNATRDNPVLDCLTLLLRTQHGERHDFYLRQHNSFRPLAAWYSTKVLSGGKDTEAVCSVAGFFKPDTFEHAFRRWLVWQEEEHLRARACVNGTMEGPLREARLPMDAGRLRVAIHTDDERLFVLFEQPSGALVCHEMEGTTLREVFTHRPSGSTPLAVQVEPGPVIHVLGQSAAGVWHERLALDGRRLSSELRLPAMPKPCIYDHVPARHLVKAAYRQGERGQRLLLTAADTRTGEVRQSDWDLGTLGAEPRELSFDLDRQGRFHLLVSTSERHLYHCTEGMEPTRLAMGEERFFPRVECGPPLYLGFYERALGYRFLSPQLARKQARSGS